MAHADAGCVGRRGREITASAFVCTLGWAVAPAWPAILEASAIESILTHSGFRAPAPPQGAGSATGAVNALQSQWSRAGALALAQRRHLHLDVGHFDHQPWACEVGQLISTDHAVAVLLQRHQQTDGMQWARHGQAFGRDTGQGTMFLIIF